MEIVLRMSEVTLMLLGMLLAFFVLALQIRMMCHTYDFLFTPKEEWKSPKVVFWSTAVVALEIVSALLMLNSLNFFHHAS